MKDNNKTLRIKKYIRGNDARINSLINSIVERKNSGVDTKENNIAIIRMERKILRLKREKNNLMYNLDLEVKFRGLNK